MPDLPALFRTDTGGRKRLGPMLLAALRRNDVEIEPGLGTVLRTAWLREELRARAYAGVVDEALEVLEEEGIEPLVLKGAALAPTVYPEPTLRHAHDIDLLLSADELSAAARALERAGFRCGGTPDESPARTLLHRTETPVLVDTRLFRNRLYSPDLASMGGRAVEVELGRRTGRTLSAADHLVHALGHASYCPSRSTLLWATDAWMLATRARELDWEVFLAVVVESRLALPVALMTEFLRNELGAPVPAEIVADLVARAAEASPLERDVALYGARQTRGEHPWLDAGPAPGWRERLTLARWRIFPSRAYLEWAFEPKYAGLVPLLYLSRPFTWAMENVGWRVRRLVRGR